MNKDEKQNSKTVTDKKRNILLEENSMLTEIKEKIVRELGRLQESFSKNF